jgi:hypothetical protein
MEAQNVPVAQSGELLKAGENKVFDLAGLDTVKASNEGAEIELKHPVTNEPIGAFITVVGKDGDTYREFQRKKFNEYLRAEAVARAKGKTGQVNKSAEDYEDDMLTLLVSCTKAWRNIVFEGNNLPFTAENIRRLYKNVPWVRDQVNDAIGDLGNFLKG